MKKLEEIDKNFFIEVKIPKTDIKFYNVLEAPFKIYGVYYENGLFRRMPEAVAQSVNDGVFSLHDRTAGGRIRFITDSPYISVKVKMPRAYRVPQFSLVGTAGFDLYEKCDGRHSYINCFKMDFNFTDGYEQFVDVGNKGLCEYTINMPLFASISELYIGLAENSTVLQAPEYTYKKPVVYYGSSITHGACASHPGMSYEQIISRRIDCDYINLGFAGNARGEEEIAKYIASLDMSAFVYDYDHNAPTVEHLQKTHKRMFDIIRKKHSDLPIIIMQRPKRYLTNEEKERFKVIKATYDCAKDNGDQNVYLLDAQKLTELCGDEGRADNCHPNDFGFASMAKAVGDVLENILKGN